MLLPKHCSVAMLLTALTSFFTTVQAWGAIGHRTTTALALLHLPSDPLHPSHTLLRTLLDDQEPTLASLFPDRIRYIPSFAYTAPWHYIDALDNPPYQCGINFTRDCLPADGCVVTAIANHTERVADTSLPLWQRGQSLRFMLHFFGDVHQPLHTENMDRGGNGIDIVFDGAKHNLHSVWDTLIPNKIVHLAADTQASDDIDEAAEIGLQCWDPKNETEAAYAWAGFLYSRYGKDTRVAESVDNVCVDDAVECSLEWASEANKWVCDYVMRGGLEEVKSKDLGGEYFEGAVPVIEQMIVKGGRRLARWLIEISEGLDAASVGLGNPMISQEL